MSPAATAAVTKANSTIESLRETACIEKIADMNRSDESEQIEDNDVRGDLDSLAPPASPSLKEVLDPFAKVIINRMGMLSCTPLADEVRWCYLAASDSRLIHSCFSEVPEYYATLPVIATYNRYPFRFGA
jgi:hypothetical protein